MAVCVYSMDLNMNKAFLGTNNINIVVQCLKKKVNE